MASLNCPLSIDVFSLSALDPGPFMIWHWKIALILSFSSTKANFSRWIQMQCHYYFSWELFCTVIRNFDTGKGGKYHSDQSRSTLAAEKQFCQIFSIHKYFARCLICGYKFENDLESHYCQQLFVSCYEKRALLGQFIYPSESSCFWLRSNNRWWCWFTERV